VLKFLQCDVSAQAESAYICTPERNANSLVCLCWNGRGPTFHCDQSVWKLWMPRRTFIALTWACGLLKQPSACIQEKS
jgi:hypothetical protein